MQRAEELIAPPVLGLSLKRKLKGYIDRKQYLTKN
jgi:hypothetical protein